MNQKTYRIGFACHNIHDEYCVNLIKGISESCKKHGSSLYVFPISTTFVKGSTEETRHIATQKLLTDKSLDGIVLASGALLNFVSHKLFLDKVKSLSTIPLINIALDIPNIPFITSDSKEPFQKMIRHLVVNHNCRRFILVTSGKAVQDSNARISWFEEVLKEHKIDLSNVSKIDGKFKKEIAYQKLKTFLAKDKTKYDAIVCLNDRSALGCLEVLKEKNIRVPEDVLLTGFDNSGAVEFSTPSITSIDQELFNQGYTAGELIHKALMNKLDGKEFTIPHETKIPSTEKYRESTKDLELKQIKYDYMNDSGKKVKYSKETIYNALRQQKETFMVQRLSIHFFLQEAQAVIPLNELYEKMPEYLKKVHISACAIFTYDTPIHTEISSSGIKNFVLPDKVNRSYVFEDGATQKRTKISFNPKECILPENTFTNTYNTNIVFSLFEKDFQYGYFVAVPENDDYLFFEIVFEALAKEITSATKFSNEMKSKNLLLDKTKDLQIYSNTLSHLSNTDELTGVLNRRGFMNKSERAIQRALMENKKGLLIYCNMDHLKNINDTFGHEAGDRAIILEAQFLTNTFRTSDLVARLGGDEFTVLACGLSASTFFQIKKRIEKACQDYNAKMIEPFDIVLSLGYAEFSKTNYDIDKLLSEADANQYIEKRRHHENEVK